MSNIRQVRQLLLTLKYLRFKVFQALLRPVQPFMRERRMGMFTSVLKVQENATILDLGGQPMIWASVRIKLNITILNLSGIAQMHNQSHHNITYVEGDACDVALYQNQSFDIVFSNSVIEHVGDHQRQVKFAQEVRRLGRSYWIQTPSKYFPIEAHCGMPFWWFYPEKLRQYFIAKWEKKLPEWTKMIRETRVIQLNQLSKLFPQGIVRTERVLGMPKSYVAYYIKN